MSPLRPETGRWTMTDPLQGQAAVDQWLSDHYAVADGEPQLTRAEVDEAAARLSRLHQLLGHQAAEVMSLLVQILHRRDGASRMLLRWLRSLESDAVR